MLINWFTVIAQIVNFLILVFLLKYFLYDRIIKAMDDREERIHLRLKEAEEKKQEAEQEAKGYVERNREFDEKREEMLAQAKREADARKKELTEEARQAVTNLRSMWLEAVQRDKKSFVQDLRKMAGNQVYTIARKAFRDLVDAEVEERIINVFLAQLRGMSKRKREALVTSVKESGNDVVIRSAFEIQAQMREKITRALRRQIADGIEVHYEMSSDLIMGIEVKTGGRKIAWSLQDYLDTLEEHTLQALETEVQRKSTGTLEEREKERKQKQPPDAGVEERTIAVFLAQIQGMTKKKREGLAASIREGGNEVVIRSAFEIPAKMREKITGALHREIADGIQVRYEPASDLIMGIELKTRGRKIAWSLQDYLDILEEHALQALETEAQRKPAGTSVEQKKERKRKQPPGIERSRPKTPKRDRSQETDETTTQ